MSEADGDAADGRPGAREAASEGHQLALDDARGAGDDPALVLIVEDEEPISDALALIVVEAGHEPLVARHGREALEVARARHPELIITDLMMPIMDGAEFIAALRTEARNSRGSVPPIVLMTAGGLRRAEEAGADEVLPKPFDVVTVEDILRRYIRSGWRRSTSDASPSP